MKYVKKQAMRVHTQYEVTLTGGKVLKIPVFLSDAPIEMTELEIRAEIHQLVGTVCMHVNNAGNMEIDLMDSGQHGMLGRILMVPIPFKYQDMFNAYQKHFNGNQLSGKYKNEILDLLIQHQ